MRYRFVRIPSVMIYISGCSYMWMYFFFSIYLSPPRCKRKLSIFTVIYLYVLSSVKHKRYFHCRNKNSWNILKNMFYSAEERKSSWVNGDRIYVFGVKCHLNAVRRLTLSLLSLLMLLSSYFTLCTYLLFCSWDSHSELVQEKSSLLTLLLSWCSYSDVCAYKWQCIWIIIHEYIDFTGLLTATKTVAFATKNINLRVKFLLRSPLATIYIYMLWHKNLHVRTFFLIVLRSHLLLCSRIKLKIKKRYASKF